MISKESWQVHLDTEIVFPRHHKRVVLILKQEKSVVLLKQGESIFAGFILF